MILDITENPFYILGASLWDTKDKIIELANEKYSSCDVSIIDEAKDNLLDSNKRLYFEMRWFATTCDSIDLFLEYINKVIYSKKYYDFNNYIYDSKYKDFFDTHDFKNSILCYFNILFYTFPYIDNNDVVTIIEKIERLSYYYLFMNRNINCIINSINTKRNINKFENISNSKSVIPLLNLLGNDMKDLILNKFSYLSRENIKYILFKISNWSDIIEITETYDAFNEFFSIIIEKYINNNKIDDNIISIKDNPFYIIGANITDNKNIIIELSDNKLLFENKDLIKKSQEQLLNPKKRLLSELTWFVNCTEQQLYEITNYFENITNEYGKYRFSIEGHVTEMNMTDGSSKWVEDKGIGTINIVDRFLIRFYALPYLILDTENNIYDVCHNIKEILELFELLINNTKNICDNINNYRKISGFILIDEIDINNIVFTFYRNKLRKIYQKLFDIYRIEEIAELSKLIIEQCINNSNYLINDYISEYSLYIKSFIENFKNIIIDKIDYILSKNMVTKYKEHEIFNIEHLLKDFNIFANPIQLYEKERGTVHQESIDIGNKLRELSIYCNNELKRTDYAIKINEMTKSFFPFLPEFQEIIKEDENYLRIVNLSQKPNSIINDIKYLINNKIRDAYVDEVIEEKVKAIKDWYINAKIIQEKGHNLNIQANCISLINASQALVLYVHNEKSRTDLSFKMIKELQLIFEDVPEYLQLLKNEEKTLENTVKEQKHSNLPWNNFWRKK